MKLAKLNRAMHRPTDRFDRFFMDPFFNDVWGKAVSLVNPAVNIVEHASSFAIEIAAPGLAKEDFHLNLDKDVLKIKVEKEDQDETEGRKWHRREFRFNSFERSFRLPETVAQDQINAKYDNGILVVNLPKREEAQEKPAREISIS